MSLTPTLTCLFTSIRRGWLIVDPLDDLEAVLCRDDSDPGNAGDEVLQGDSILQLALLAHRQRAELRCIAFWETGAQRQQLHLNSLTYIDYKKVHM